MSMGLKRLYNIIFIIGLILIVLALFSGEWTIVVLIAGLEFIGFALFETILLRMYIKKYGITPFLQNKKEKPKIKLFEERPKPFPSAEKTLQPVNLYLKSTKNIAKEKKLGFLSKLFKKEKTQEKHIEIKQDILKQKEEPKIAREEKTDKSYVLLLSYVKDSMSQNYPINVIRDAAIKSDWPPEFVDKAIEEAKKTDKKRKVRVLLIMLAALIVLVVILQLSGLLVFSYWLQSFKYASTGFYMLTILVSMSIIMLFAIRVKKVIKQKQVQYRIVESEHVEEIKKAIVTFGGEYQTELDKLYALLSEKGKLTLSEIAKGFSISKEAAEEWGKILKDQNLIDLHYPTVGEPELKWKSLSATQ